MINKTFVINSNAHARFTALFCESWSGLKHFGEANDNSWPEWKKAQLRRDILGENND